MDWFFFFDFDNGRFCNFVCLRNIRMFMDVTPVEFNFSGHLISGPSAPADASAVVVAYDYSRIMIILLTAGFLRFEKKKIINNEEQPQCDRTAVPYTPYNNT